MMSRGFKPVAWVAGVAAAAISCYMLSLNVASERAELAKIERSIVMAKKDIRSLETELGTRGRLQQLENWNANVLALSAPKSAQFLDDAVTLARFEQREKTMEEHAVVRMANAEAPKPQPQVNAPIQYAAAPATPAPEAPPMVHRASVVVTEAKLSPPPAKPAAPQVKRVASPAKPAAPEAKPVAGEAKKVTVATKAAPAPKKSSLIEDDVVKAIGDAAKAEKSGSAGGQ